MHVKITNGTIDQYPYTVGQLRRDNPQTSFPKRIPDEMLEEWGVVPVVVEDRPTIDDRTQKVSQAQQPTKDGDTWILAWSVTDKSQEEIQQYDDSVAASIRHQRDNLLAASDWTQVPDAPVDQAAWAVYRQALRDITTQAGFPHEVTWPVKPE